MPLDTSFLCLEPQVHVWCHFTLTKNLLTSPAVVWRAPVTKRGLFKEFVPLPSRRTKISPQIFLILFTLRRTLPPSRHSEGTRKPYGNTSVEGPPCWRVCRGPPLRAHSPFPTTRGVGFFPDSILLPQTSYPHLSSFCPSPRNVSGHLPGRAWYTPVCVAFGTSDEDAIVFNL